MHSKDNLTKRFGNADLPLVLPGAPFANTDRNIFQMDILTRKRAESFRLYPGHEDNQVRVQGTDKKIRQLVLFVKEPARTFEEERPFRPFEDKEKVIADLKSAGGKIARVHKTKVVLEMTTFDDKRHYLCGHDESHLFISQLPRPAATVREAHEALRAPAARGRNALRQGEWFFVELTEGEKNVVQHAIGQGLLQKNVNLGLAFSPPRIFGSRGITAKNKRRALAAHVHLAEEAVIIPSGGAITVYVRGGVRHVDHKTLNLYNWTRVARNNEPTQTTGGTGIHWID